MQPLQTTQGTFFRGLFGYVLIGFSLTFGSGDWDDRLSHGWFGIGDVSTCAFFARGTWAFGFVLHGILPIAHSTISFLDRTTSFLGSATSSPIPR